MSDLKQNYVDSVKPEDLIIKIGEHLSTLRVVINSEDFDFKKSKKNVIETLELAEGHLSDLLNKIQ